MPVPVIAGLEMSCIYLAYISLFINMLCVVIVLVAFLLLGKHRQITRAVWTQSSA